MKQYFLLSKKNVEQRGFILASLLAVFLLIGCENGSVSEAAAEQERPQSQVDASAAERLVRVETKVLHPKEFRDRIAVIGVLSSPNDAVISAQSSGTIERLSPLGSSVKAGEIIARLDAALVKAILEQAEATLEASKSSASLASETFRRQEALYRDSIISALEFDQIRAQKNQALADLSRSKAAVSQARKQLEYSFVRAPFSGKVESHLVDEGEQVAPGSPILRLVDSSHLKLRAGVPERYAIDIKIGTEVDIYFKAYGVENRSGTISFVGNVIDPSSRSFPIEIALENQAGELKPEMIADVLVTRAVLADQLVLPQTAIILDDTGSSAYIVDRSSGIARATRRAITSGASFDGQTVINDGLVSGDEVIIVGQSTVSEGDALDIVTAS